MLKVGVIFLLLFFYFNFAQVCPAPLNSSFIRSYYELDGDKAKVYLNVFTENKGDSLVGPYLPIKNSFILLTLKNESDNSNYYCYVVSDEDGKATAQFDVLPQTCYVVSAEFVPLASSDLLKKPSCSLSSSILAKDYSQNYSKSFTQLKFCTPKKQNATFNLCWFSTIIAGIIFLANFIMGRNPLMFFDFGVARQLPSRHFSSTLYYSPMTKQKEPKGLPSLIQKIRNNLIHFNETYDRLKNAFSSHSSSSSNQENNSPTPTSPNPNQQPPPSNTSNQNNNLPTPTSPNPNQQPPSSNPSSPKNQPSESTSQSGLNKILGLIQRFSLDPISAAYLELKSGSGNESESGTNKERKDASFVEKAIDIGIVSATKGLVNMVAFAVTPRKTKFVQRAPFRGPFFKGLAKTAKVGGLSILNSSAEMGLNELSNALEDKLKKLSSQLKDAESYPDSIKESIQKEIYLDYALNSFAFQGISLIKGILSSTKDSSGLKTGNRAVDDTINQLVNQSSGEALSEYFLYKTTLDGLTKGK